MENVENLKGEEEQIHIGRSLDEVGALGEGDKIKIENGTNFTVSTRMRRLD